MSRSFTTRSATALVLLAAFWLPANARADVIVTVLDSFNNVENNNTDQVSITNIGGSFATFGISPPVTDPIGSSRYLQVDQAKVGESSSLTINGLGKAELASSAGGSSIWTVRYGEQDVVNLNLDASAGGANAFRLSFASVASLLEFKIRVFSPGGNGFSNANTFVPVGLESDVYFPNFSNFSNIDFDDLDAIEVVIRDPSGFFGGSASLDTFSTVAIPEPSSFALGGMAIAGLIARFRRRRVAPVG